MRRRSLVALALGGGALLAHGGLGCNAMTGASDLEPVDCIEDCGGATDTGTALLDSARPDTADTRRDDAVTETLDTSIAETPDAADDVADAADAVDTGDTKADGPEVGKSCKGDLDCNDTNACTTDICDKAGGVLFGSCTNTKVDADGDGESPTSLGSCGTDCNDSAVYGKNVFSKQVAWFTTPIPPIGSSYDYNCSGTAELQFPTVYKCTRVGTSCAITSPGWLSVPACGASGSWVAACVYNAGTGTCLPSGATSKVQGCH